MTRDGWLQIRLRHLEALDRAERDGSFTAAAAALGYAPSAVARQVEYLERLVGRRLLVRAKRGRPLRPTDAGRALLPHARTILAELAGAGRGQSAPAARGPAPLRLGIEAGAGDLLEERVLAGVRCVPCVVAARGLGTREALHALRDGRLDAALLALPVRHGPFSAIELEREAHVLAVPGSWPSPPRDVTTARDLAGLELVEVAGSAAARSLAARHVQPRLRVASTTAARALVRSGTAAAVLPEREASPLAPVAHVVALRALVAPCSMGLVWPAARDRDPGLAPLLAAARALAASSRPELRADAA